MTATMTCPHCNAAGQNALFCRACDRYMSDESGLVEKVTFNRRFFGDWLLEGVLFLVTLIIGWYIWLIFTAQTAQTPAKRLLNVYIIDMETGEPLSAGKVWIREVLIKQILLNVVNAFIGVAGIIDALWLFFDRNRQTLHDKVASTIVVYVPTGLPGTLRRPEVLAARAPGGVGTVAEELRELAKLHAEGILTDEEYEAKRKGLADRL
jgi:uncharacterized RDD family membrane protein YckC